MSTNEKLCVLLTMEGYSNETFDNRFDPHAACLRVTESELDRCADIASWLLTCPEPNLQPEVKIRGGDPLFVRPVTANETTKSPFRSAQPSGATRLSALNTPHEGVTWCISGKWWDDQDGKATLDAAMYLPPALQDAIRWALRDPEVRSKAMRHALLDLETGENAAPRVAPHDICDLCDIDEATDIVTVVYGDDAHLENVERYLASSEENSPELEDTALSDQLRAVDATRQVAWLATHTKTKLAPETPHDSGPGLGL